MCIGGPEMLSYKCRLFGQLVYIFFICLFHVLQASIKVVQPLPLVTGGDAGSKLILYCNVSGLPHPQLIWLKNGQKVVNEQNWRIQESEGVLTFEELLKLDEGNYSCRAENRFDTVELKTQIIIRTPPEKLLDVNVHPSTVVATVHWRVSNDGGYPITHFTLMYRPLYTNNSETWHLPFPVHISPVARQVFVYHLRPGTVYMFRLWATNKLGPGEATLVQASTIKPLEPPDVIQHMLANSDEFSSAAWMVAISMVMGTVLVLSCLSCVLIYKEGRNEIPDEIDVMPHIITNPGFEIDLEESYLLEHADYNDNIEQTVRVNNNSVVQPSVV